LNSLVGALERAQRALTASGIQSAAIGALALSIWGRARATSDVDLKVLVARDRAADLLAALPGYTPLVEEPLQVIQRLGFVFLRDPQGVRIDLLLADAGFDEGASGGPGKWRFCLDIGQWSARPRTWSSTS